MTGPASTRWVLGSVQDPELRVVQCMLLAQWHWRSRQWLGGSRAAATTGGGDSALGDQLRGLAVQRGV
jgi:hypothetical protein